MELDKLNDELMYRFEELDELKDEFEELDKLNCKLMSIMKYSYCNLSNLAPPFKQLV